MVPNGFDPEDKPVISSPSDAGTLEIVYTGTLYDGLSDPTPLLKAARALEQDTIGVRVHFYGSDSHLALRRAQELGFERFVLSHGAVPYCDSLRAQVDADALLVLDQGKRTVAGVLTGKLYEYIGARRPILVVGRSDYTAAQLVTDQGLGYVSRDPAGIARFLRELYNEKQRYGHVADLETDTSPYTRSACVDALVAFLEQIIRETSPRGGSRG